MLVTAFMIIFALPSVVLASGMLICDRLVGTHFYNAAEHGGPLLWQHLFWFFGHPEVYIIFLPGAAFVSEIVADLLAPAGVRLSGHRRLGGRDRACSPSASGSTTCSRPACRGSAMASTPRRA